MKQEQLDIAFQEVIATKFKTKLPIYSSKELSKEVSALSGVRCTATKLQDCFEIQRWHHTQSAARDTAAGTQRTRSPSQAVRCKLLLMFR